MHILILTSSILQCLVEEYSPELIDKIRHISNEFELKFAIFDKENNPPKDWDKYKIKAKILLSSDLFCTLSKMGKTYGDLALFVIMHNLDDALIDRYLHAQHPVKLCFLDISKEPENDYRYFSMSDEDDTPGLVLHSTGSAYKYRDLTSKAVPSLRLKIYELPGVNVH